MSEQITSSSPLVVTKTWLSNAIMLYSLRAAQLLLTIITLGLTGYVVDDFYANDAANYGVATSVLSLVYLIFVGIFTFLKPGLFIGGAFLIVETVIMVLWFCAFIVIAADWGRVTCSDLSDSNVSWAGYYYYGSFRQPCAAAQAAIAMSAINWLLFCFSLFLLIWNVVLPISRAYSSKSLWEVIWTHGVGVHKLTGLALISNETYPTDIEAALSPKQNASSSNSELEPVTTEKIVEEQPGEDPELIVRPPPVVTIANS